MNILGIDIGGTGIKGAPVDISTGALFSGAEAHSHPLTSQAESGGRGGG